MWCSSSSSFFYGAFRIIERSLVSEAREATGQASIQLALINPTNLQPTFPTTAFAVTSFDDEKEVPRDEFDAILTIHDSDEGSIVANAKVHASVQEVLSQARQELRASEISLSQEDLQRVLAPFRLEMLERDRAPAPNDKNARLVFALFFVFLSLAAVFSGNAQLLMSITAEKQLKVTEQLIWTVRPSAWLDGKVLGLSAFCFMTMISGGLGVLLFVGMAKLVGLKTPALSMFLDISPNLALTLGILAICSFAVWFTFFAYVSTTIPDPRTSSRSALVFLPIVALGFGLFAVKFPDTTAMKVCSFVPGIAPAVLSTRLVVSDVSTAEVFGSIGVALVTIWLIRQLALWTLRRQFKIGSDVALSS